MSELCEGCRDNMRSCTARRTKSIDPKDCPCANCIVKSMCNSGCDDYYGLAHGTKLKGKK